MTILAKKKYIDTDTFESMEYVIKEDKHVYLNEQPFDTFIDSSKFYPWASSHTDYNDKMIEEFISSENFVKYLMQNGKKVSIEYNGKNVRTKYFNTLNELIEEFMSIDKPIIFRMIGTVRYQENKIGLVDFKHYARYSVGV